MKCVCCEANRCKNLSPHPFRQLNEITLAWFLQPFSESLNSDFILHQDPKSYSILPDFAPEPLRPRGAMPRHGTKPHFFRESGWIAKT
jgi:hypothetical protein